MPRPNQSAERRRELLPRIAAAFARSGYRQVTTATLAEACVVRENVLYRLWSDKREMFIASLLFVYEKSEAAWREVLAGEGVGSAAERLLAYEAQHLGEHGLHRLVFSALGETDDEAIRAALRQMYEGFSAFIAERVEEHRQERGEQSAAARIAWAILGLGTAANIGRELGLLDAEQRSRLIAELGGVLLEG